MKPKPFSAIAWLDEHQELVAEIDECRIKGYTWRDITTLLTKYHGYQGSHDSLQRAFSDAR